MESSLLNNYVNKWVALSKDRTKVLAFANSLKDLVKQLKKNKEKDVIFHYVQPTFGVLAP